MKKTIKIYLLLYCCISILHNIQAQETTTSSEIVQQQKEPIKTFSFDEQTGGVIGCDLIKLQNIKTAQVNKDNTETSAKIRHFFDKSTRKPEPKIIGESLGGILSKNGKYFVAQDMSDGGIVHGLYFYNNQGKLLNKVLFEYKIFGNVSFNDEETYVKFSSPFNPTFYFCSPDGKIFQKGDVNAFIHDNGTSYGWTDISKSGKFWLLSNNSSYVFDKKGVMIDKIDKHIHKSYIDETKKIIYFFDSKYYLYIYDIENKIYLFKSLNQILDGYSIENKKIIIFNQLKNKEFIYEIK